MAYNPNLPANDGFLATFPPEMREQLRAIIEDMIVNAAKLKGLDPGNASGNIPVSNGTLCTNLNAEKIGGLLASAFALAGHVHAVATGSANGLLSSADFTKLQGIQSGAEVNQNAFSNVLVNGTTIQADSKTDTLEIVGGANITVTPDATNDRLTIAVTGKVGSAGYADSAGSANYATTAGSAPANGGYSAGSFAEYISGGSQVPNYYGPNKLRLSMLYTGWGWADCLWMSSYAGGDVKLSNQLVFSKSGGRAGFRQQNFDSDTWGSIYEFIHSGNIGSQSVNYANSAGSAPANGGNATTATKLATARTISLAGGVNGSTTFDGSVNVTITATVADNSHNHTIANVAGLQTALDNNDAWKFVSKTTLAAAASKFTITGLDFVNYDYEIVIDHNGANYPGPGGYYMWAYPAGIGRSESTGNNDYAYIHTSAVGNGTYNHYNCGTLYSTGNPAIGEGHSRKTIRAHLTPDNYFMLLGNNGFDGTYGISWGYYVTSTAVTPANVAGITFYTTGGTDTAALVTGMPAGLAYTVFRKPRR